MINKAGPGVSVWLEIHPFTWTIWPWKGLGGAYPYAVPYVGIGPFRICWHA